MTHWILVINPGSTSTKLALLKTRPCGRQKPCATVEDLAPVIVEQLDFAPSWRKNG